MSFSDQLGNVKPRVGAAANTIAAQFGLKTGYGWRSGSEGDHPRGMAVDFPASKDTGDKVAAFVTANASRLGVKYVIWQQAIWKPSAPTWTPMAYKSGDRPGYDPNHRRHVHVSFTDAGPTDSSPLQTVRDAVGNVTGTVGSAVTGAVANVGSVIDALNPFDDWAQQAMVIALKIAATGAGLALLVVGATRLVAPAATKTIGKAAEALG